MKHSAQVILFLAVLGLGACTGPTGPRDDTSNIGAKGETESTGSGYMWIPRLPK